LTMGCFGEAAAASLMMVLGVLVTACPRAC
jgi:hypothetical protein